MIILWFRSTFRLFSDLVLNDTITSGQVIVHQFTPGTPGMDMVLLHKEGRT